jgi:hypothetical protein
MEDWFNNLDKFVWQIVSAGISICVGLWILSLFLPVDRFFSWVGSCFSRREKVVVVRRCTSCEADSPMRDDFCSKCGEKLS